MLAREALQMNPNARAIIRNPLAIPKCEFYDAFRSTQSCFLLFKFHLVNALTERWVLDDDGLTGPSYVVRFVLLSLNPTWAGDDRSRK